jgi:hypothetical protein
MPRGDYTPEIRTSLGSSKPGRVNTSPPKVSPADISTGRAGGDKSGGAKSMEVSSMPQNRGPSQPPKMQTAPAGNLPPDLPHVAAATSIAHAILNRRPGGA